MELADTSAWAWTRSVGGGLRTEFDEAVVDGEIATCAMVELELLYSARNADEFASLRGDLGALPKLPMGETVWTRALDVYERLARQGGMHQRSVKHPDLMMWPSIRSRCSRAKKPWCSPKRPVSAGILERIRRLARSAS